MDAQSDEPLGADRWVEAEPQVTTSCFACRRTLLVPVSTFDSRCSISCFDVGVEGCFYAWKGLS